MSQELPGFTHGLRHLPARDSPLLPALPPAQSGRRLAVPPVTSRVRFLSWISRGACRQADPGLFFPIGAVTGSGARRAEAAKAVCGPCAVRADCLSYALEAMPEGIWGGTTEEERLAARGSSVRRARLAAGAVGPARQDSVMSVRCAQRDGHVRGITARAAGSGLSRLPREGDGHG